MPRYPETCSECWLDDLYGRRNCYHSHYYRYRYEPRPYYRYRYEPRPYYRRYDRCDASVDLEAFSLLVLGACKGTAFLAKFATRQAKKVHQSLRVRHLGTAA